MPKTLDICDIIKKTLEEACKTRGIEFTRKNRGLRLDLFCYPELYMTNDKVYIQTVSGTGKFGARHYHRLEFKIGDIANPKTDIEAVVNRVIAAVEKFQDIERLGDVAEWRVKNDG